MGLLGDDHYDLAPVEVGEAEAEQARRGPTLEQLLSTRFGESSSAAIDQVAYESGMSGPQRVLGALALVKGGVALEKVADSLTWAEFEEFCSGALLTAGYNSRRNIRLRKPTRQIDLLAESPSLLLSVDCKHWKRSLGWSALEKIALAQVERTRQYKTRLDVDDRPILPVVITLADNEERVVARVPIVPLFALKGFLWNVNSYEKRLLFL